MKAPPISRVEARLQHEAEYRFRLSFASGAPSILTDEPPPLGGTAGPDPTALLAAAVGNCLASSFLFCVRKARVEPEELTVEVAVTRERDEHGRMRIGSMHVRMEPRLAEGDAARIGRCLELFESFCIVTESVRRGIRVDLDVVPVVPSSPGSREGAR